MLHLEQQSGSKKRKRGEKGYFRFSTFGEHGHPTNFDGSFLENVKCLLAYGNFENDFLGNGMHCWSFPLEVDRQSSVFVSLLVIEEPVEASLDRHCKHCLYVGWGQHLICNKKYHFLLPSKSDNARSICAYLGFNNSRPTKDISAAYTLEVLEGYNNITMHGVFHSNGFGHLLCINGIETNSILTGFQIMDFWDRLCSGLRARKVSLSDVSQKKSMELRLIHGIAYGEPWFGHWGYQFARGTFGVTLPMYKKALQTIRAIPLCFLMHHFGNSLHDILKIYSKYQPLSNHMLVTFGDLLHFMLELMNSHNPLMENRDNNNQCSSFGMLLKTTSCRWSPKRVEMAIKVIVDALKRARVKWVSRQELRDAARMYIGDTGLLDFVLKSLGNHVVGNFLVRRCLNPVTKVLEYSLEEVSKSIMNQEGLVMTNSNSKTPSKINKTQLYNDIFYLYENILKDHQNLRVHSYISSTIPLATRIILDVKYLVKQYNDDLLYKIEIDKKGKLKLFCTISLKGFGSLEENLSSMSRPPFECIMLKENAAIDELKKQVERTFRELYWGLRSFTIESIVNLSAKDNEMVSRVIEVGRKVVFEGRVRENGVITKNVYEGGGLVDRIIDCNCGVKDDDGERMICCDICEVWQHTRCVQIPNDEQVPNIFLCKRCEQEIVLFPSLP